MAAALRRTVHGACQDSGLRVDREALELLADLVSQHGEPALHSLLERVDPGDCRAQCTAALVALMAGEEACTTASCKNTAGVRLQAGRPHAHFELMSGDTIA